MSLSFNYFLLISCSFERFSSNYFIIIWSGWWERISTCWEIQKISLGRSAFWVKFWFLRGWMKPTTNHKFCNTHTHTHKKKRVYIIPNYLQILLKMLKHVHIDKVQAILISCSFVRFSSNYFIIIWSGWWKRISTCWEIQKISLGRSAFC